MRSRDLAGRARQESAARVHGQWSLVSLVESLDKPFCTYARLCVHKYTILRTPRWFEYLLN